MTITKILKKSIVESMKEGVSYDRAAIKQLIQENTGMCFGVDYKESHLAGTISALIKKGILVCKERGIYELAYGGIDDNTDTEEPQHKEDMEQAENNELKKIKKLVEESINKEKKYLKEITSNMKISLDTVNRQELDNIMKIKELVEYLEGFQLN